MLEIVTLTANFALLFTCLGLKFLTSSIKLILVAEDSLETVTSDSTENIKGVVLSCNLYKPSYGQVLFYS